jgi:hypothetical protein
LPAVLSVADGRESCEGQEAWEAGRDQLLVPAVRSRRKRTGRQTIEGEVKRGAEETCLTVYLVEAMKRSALGFHERIDSTLIEAGNLSAARAAADTWLREKGFDSKTISDARIVVGDLIVAE